MSDSDDWAIARSPGPARDEDSEQQSCFDWDSDSSLGTPRGDEEGAADGALVPLEADGAFVPCATPPRPEPKARVKWTIKLPAPRHRSRCEEIMAASRMRENRAKQLRERDAQRTKGLATSMNQALARLRARGVLHDHGRATAVQIKTDGGIALSIDSARRKVVAPESLIACAFSEIRGRNDCARAFSIPKKTVSTLRYVIAHVVEDNEAAFMRDLAAAFRGALPPEIFCSSLSADSTKEKLELPLHPDILSHVSRSSWNVCVSMQKFSWQWPDQDTTTH